MTDQIRPYGPGKFSTILDSYVYSVSLDGGADEECGSVDGGTWYGLMRNGRTIFRDHDPLLESLNEAEQEQLTASAGVIVSEDSQGFVSVEYFETEKDLDAAWAEVEAEVAEDENEDEDGAICPECERSYGPHYRGRCSH